MRNPPRHWATLCTTTLLLAGCCAHPAVTHSAPLAAAPLPKNFLNVRALILVRHADVSIPQKRKEGDATPLLPRGEARGKELAFALQDAHITRIFTTQTVRTETTASLADTSHVPVETPFPHGASPADVLSYIASHTRPSDVVLLVENHSVIPRLLQDLGFPNQSPINEPVEFDRLYVLLPDRATGTYRLLRLRYGGNWGTPPAAQPPR